MAPSATKSPKKPDTWELKLYVAGHTLKCKSAFTNLKKICEKCLPGKYRIKVIDLLEKPQLAKSEQILAIPTLVKRYPLPLRRTIGDLSNEERVLKGLDMPC